MAEQQRAVPGKSVESSGKTIDEAIENALARLNVSRDAVEVTVLREASRGLLGFGAHEAIVKLTVRQPDRPASPYAAEARAEDKTEAAPVAVPRIAEPPRPAAPSEGTDDEQDEGEVVAPAPQATRPTAVGASDDAGEIARQILLDMIERMGLIADVQLLERPPEDEKDKGTIVLDVIGDDLGLLIGRQGSTLNDLQYITRQLVANKVGHWVNLMVDVEGYKQRREDRLRELARRIAQRVEDTGRPAHMEPMNSYERRLVHLELSKIKGVETESTGEGDRRKVGIYPAGWAD